jgi:acyl-CoA synthetase (AMP-forming)/AMP-acid ligase II
MGNNKTIFIFDIDGTLAYNDSEGEMKTFPPIKEVLKIAISAQKSGKSRVAIVTARPEVSRQDTEEWVRKQGLKPELLLMRANDDFRPDHEVRVDQVEQVMKKLGSNAVLYDDKLPNCNAVKSKLKIAVRRVLS